MFWDAKEAVKVLRFVNKTCDNHALALLAICYFPGVLAAYIQVKITIQLPYIGRQLTFITKYSKRFEKPIPIVYRTNKVPDCNNIPIKSLVINFKLS